MRVKIITSSLFATLFVVFTFTVNAQVSSITGTTDSTVTTPKQRQGITREENDLLLKNTRETKTIRACTQDVKQCPDGSYVSRQPPTCVFAPCLNLRDKREKFKEKLQIIRDEGKKAMVERIDEKISTMNKKHTARFSAVLEKLEMILNKIRERAERAKLQGLDTTMVDAAIVAAKTAIDAAKAAVTVQTVKSYSIEVVSETALRTTVGSVVSMFRKDLRDVHKIVVDAKQAVQKAEKELAKVKGEKMEKAGENQSIRETPSVSEK